MIKNYFRILRKPHAYLQAILKAHVKFQNDRPKTVGGVKGTRYLLPIDFCNIRTQKMSVKNAEKVIKNYFRILKKPHAYLQTILKTPVKFQKERTETVGGVKGTKYLLKTRNHAPSTTPHAPRATHHAPRTTPHGKPKAVSLHFSSKRRGTKNRTIYLTYIFYFI